MKQNINILLENVKKLGLDYYKNERALMEYSNDMMIFIENID